MTDRRSFIAGMLAAGACPKPTWAEVGSPAFLSAGVTQNGTHVLCGLTARGKISFELPLPARGHAAAAHPMLAEAVAFARRPGTFAVVIDCVSGREKARLHAPAGRHFYGHGTYSADGDLLFTTENDFGAARGVIGVWDPRDGYARLDELPSGGTGPHDIKLMPDGKTLVVANGGIETHPETGRLKLNIPTMRPNLSYLSFDGRVEEKIELDRSLRRNSIRHLATTSDGTVAFAMQWQGDRARHPPLIGIHQAGSPAMLLETTGRHAEKMKGYVGSVAASQALGRIAATSPRGNLVQVVDIRTQAIVAQSEIEDVCGVAALDAGFFLTSGHGQIAMQMGAGHELLRGTALRWDNHLVAVSMNAPDRS
ncbi:MAG: DUF1513 domain-containing protein [Boseongicola sp. SB0662_bin_57]|nr:DUF1513 domain-containing protein [Boseongicola sp. SB0662_bin_57]